MTSRKRNLFVLLLVAALFFASLAIISRNPTHEGLDLKGGISLVYQAKPTKQSAVTPDALNHTIDIMRNRVDQLGVSEPSISSLGSNQIAVGLPGATNQARAEDEVGKVAQMYFYDWEKNLLYPPNLKPRTETANAGDSSSPAVSQYEAVRLASKRPAMPGRNTSTGGQWYGLDTKQQKVICGPDDTYPDLTTDCKAQLALPRNRNATVDKKLQVKEGTVIVQAPATPTNPSPDAFYILNDDYALAGKDVRNPQQNFTQGSGQPDVTFGFSGRGNSIWQKVTKQIASRGRNSTVNGSAVTCQIAAGGSQVLASECAQHFAVVLDGQLITVPYIDYKQNPGGIDSSIGGSEISGNFTIKTAQDLANELKSGALPLKLNRISSSFVSATLGKQALNQGLIAGIIGFVIVAIFLLAFYRVLGMIAVGALIVYGVYFFALIKWIPITLTLPGIAGLILTIGVAADANIVIFERIKEEIRGGKSIAAGIATGYKRGIAAIADANFVTFITAFILFAEATAGVKGFALVLGIGTLVSLFTAVLATQAVLGTLGQSRLLRSPQALGAGKKHREWKFDFMGASKWFFSVSGVILLIGALAIAGKGLNFGIDFKSGTRITASFVKATDENGVRNVLSGQNLADAEIQRVTNDKLGKNAFQISTKFLSTPQQTAVTRALDNKFELRGEPEATSVGPTFGQTVANSAIKAIIASLLVISIYIGLRFQWKYAVPVLIALMHDLLITAGVYALLGREVTTSTVAALLTILGYSLYDTIIVFDRVRENVPRMPRAAFSQIVNRSMSEVLTRSLATTFCTLLPVAALLLFGGDTLKDFAFALLVGVASGAYSSIFIASPVLTHWKEREPAYAQRRARIMAEHDGVLPPYALAGDGSAIEVAPPPRKQRRSILSTDVPGDTVGAGEFAEMVRGIQEDVRPKPAARDAAADLDPEDLVLKDSPKKPKQRKPRNTRHGRPR
jgi:SecD/SecF fusion protein